MQFLYLTTLEMPWEKHHFPRARVPETLPVVLSPGEVQTFFHHVEGVKNRAVLLTCYGAPACASPKPWRSASPISTVSAR